MTDRAHFRVGGGVAQRALECREAGAAEEQCEQSAAAGHEHALERDGRDAAGAVDGLDVLRGERFGEVDGDVLAVECGECGEHARVVAQTRAVVWTRKAAARPTSKVRPPGSSLPGPSLSPGFFLFELVEVLVQVSLDGCLVARRYGRLAAARAAECREAARTPLTLAAPGVPFELTS